MADSGLVERGINGALAIVRPAGDSRDRRFVGAAAIVFREEGWDALLDRIEASPAAAGTPTLAEAGIVLQARLGKKADGLLERLLDELSIQEIPFGEIHWREAVDAYRRYGKGRHTAGLNFGDCMTYAVARLAGEPLLYVGDDFARTDLDAG